MKIRKLKADEIEILVTEVTHETCRLILYKKAACVVKMLNEVFGVLGWQKSYQEVHNNLFCTLTVWDNEQKEWISRSDAGAESTIESKKGHATDAFKRAATNFGIGAELNTAPNIYIQLFPVETEQYEPNRFRCKVRFYVKSIAYRNGKISKLIIHDEFDNVRYYYPNNLLSEVRQHCIDRIEDCKTLDELRSIWSSYKVLRKDNKILDLIDNKKEELNNSQNKEVKEKFDGVLKKGTN